STVTVLPADTDPVMAAQTMQALCGRYQVCAGRWFRLAVVLVPAGTEPVMAAQAVHVLCGRHQVCASPALRPVRGSGECTVEAGGDRGELR
ncbi:MAG: hypothetical protein QOD04_1990, partial [Pseudonocardiales bacterium]|nr:hypothetical protein [Pseudonocardiales bacterium]